MAPVSNPGPHYIRDFEMTNQHGQDSGSFRRDTGEPWAKISDVKAGSRLHTDRGFTCIGERDVEIKEDDNGHLYFLCHQRGSGTWDRHYLAGQANDDHYIGLTWASGHAPGSQTA